MSRPRRTSRPKPPRIRSAAASGAPAAAGIETRPATAAARASARVGSGPACPRAPDLHRGAGLPGPCLARPPSREAPPAMDDSETKAAVDSFNPPRCSPGKPQPLTMLGPHSSRCSGNEDPGGRRRARTSAPRLCSGRWRSRDTTAELARGWRPRRSTAVARLAAAGRRRRSTSSMPGRRRPRGVAGACARPATAHRVLMLTARDAIDDRVDGLDAGADDYLRQAVRAARAAARGCAPCCAGSRPPRPGTWRFADLALDPATRATSAAASAALELTDGTEFGLLELFLAPSAPGAHASQIFEQVWGYDLGATSNCARRLRRLPAPQDGSGRASRGCCTRSAAWAYCARELTVTLRRRPDAHVRAWRWASRVVLASLVAYAGDAQPAARQVDRRLRSQGDLVPADRRRARRRRPRRPGGPGGRTPPSSPQVVGPDGGCARARPGRATHRGSARRRAELPVDQEALATAACSADGGFHRIHADGLHVRVHDRARSRAARARCSSARSLQRRGRVCSGACGGSCSRRARRPRAPRSPPAMSAACSRRPVIAPIDRAHAGRRAHRGHRRPGRRRIGARRRGRGRPNGRSASTRCSPPAGLAGRRSAGWWPTPRTSCAPR